MSHFTVLVIGENPEEQLAPFHQFECTGINDKHVIDIDETEERLEEYNENTVTRLKAPDKTLKEPWDEQFYRLPLPGELDGHEIGSGWNGKVCYKTKTWSNGVYESRVKYIPEGFEEVQVPVNSLYSFRDYLTEYCEIEHVPYGWLPDLDDSHKYHYVMLTSDGGVEKVIRRTNPNYHWDWYELGGRWSGFFKRKFRNVVQVDHQGFAIEEERFALGRTGRGADYGTCDQGVKKFIDFDLMREEAAKKASREWDIAQSIISPLPICKSWKEIAEPLGYSDEARRIYGSQPRVIAFREAAKDNKEWPFGYMTEVFDLQISKEEYVQNAVDATGVTHAVIKDGVWYERGSMGWWGIVSDKKEASTWNAEFRKLIDIVDGNILLSIYDCHI